METTHRTIAVALDQISAVAQGQALPQYWTAYLIVDPSHVVFESLRALGAKIAEVAKDSVHVLHPQIAAGLDLVFEMMSRQKRTHSKSSGLIMKKCSGHGFWPETVTLNAKPGKLQVHYDATFHGGFFRESSSLHMSTLPACFR
jgi:hypothetical protein